MKSLGRPRKTYLELCLEISENTEVQQDGCIVWKGLRHHSGYGLIAFRGKQWRAHVLALTLDYENKGLVIPKLQANHHCDEKLCINPEHLYFGTQRQNMADCASRMRRACGATHGRAKLNPQKVIEIRDLFANHHWKQSKLAAYFGVARSRISELITRKTWSSI